MKTTKAPPDYRWKAFVDYLCSTTGRGQDFTGAYYGLDKRQIFNMRHGSPITIPTIERIAAKLNKEPWEVLRIAHECKPPP